MSFQSPSRINIVPPPAAITTGGLIGSSPGCFPNITGEKSKLSGPASSGSSAPVKLANVASRAVKQIVCPLELPASTIAGQRTIKGMRWPASQASAFIPLRPPAESWPNRFTSASYQTGPLSELKMTMVSSRIPDSSIFRNTLPIIASTITMKSPYRSAPLFPTYSSSGSQGVCGAGKARYRNKGLASSSF